MVSLVIKNLSRRLRLPIRITVAAQKALILKWTSVGLHPKAQVCISTFKFNFRCWVRPSMNTAECGGNLPQGI